MGPGYNDREPQPQESGKGSRPRRRFLSDLQTESHQTQPQTPAEPPSRPMLASQESGETQRESPSPGESRHPRLADSTPGSQGLEPRPRAQRPRLAVALAADDEVPGLQSILDLPCPAGGRTAARQADAEPLNCDRCVRQRFSLALAGGLAAAGLGATGWALTAMATSHQTAWMALAVGLLVGGTVQTLGRGSGKPFGCLGAGLTVLGCLLGNLLSVCTLVAGQQGLSTPAVLAHVCRDPALIAAAMIATFHPLDLLFYGIALYEGYHLSLRRVTGAR
jgi:hypothetical protein